jgi:hypothetical protein
MFINSSKESMKVARASRPGDVYRADVVVYTLLGAAADRLRFAREPC